MDKATLRAHIRQLRRQMTADERRDASATIARFLRDSALWRQASTIAVYAATPAEVNLDVLFDDASKRLVVPRVNREPWQLTWHHVVAPPSLIARGLREPPPTAPTVSVDDIDLWLIPAIAIDDAGHRLGQGGGFYDRSLARTQAPVVATVFQCQRVPTVPVDAHDHPVNRVVTEAGWTTF